VPATDVPASVAANGVPVIDVVAAAPETVAEQPSLAAEATASMVAHRPDESYEIFGATAAPGPNGKTAVDATSNGGAVADVVDAAAPTAPLATPVPHPASSDSTPDFWPEQPTQKRKGLLRRIPLSAVLEVIAVLLILVFILLRLS